MFACLEDYVPNDGNLSALFYDVNIRVRLEDDLREPQGDALALALVANLHFSVVGAAHSLMLLRCVST